MPVEKRAIDSTLLIFSFLGWFAAITFFYIYSVNYGQLFTFFESSFRYLLMSTLLLHYLFFPRFLVWLFETAVSAKNEVDSSGCVGVWPVPSTSTFAETIV